MTIEPHIQALIFDCDGTLADTMPLHHLAWQETVQAAGGHLPDGVIDELAGASDYRIAMALNDRYGYQLDSQEMAREKNRHFLTHLPQVQPIGPVVNIARQYKGRLPMAVASGGYRPAVQAILATIGMDNFFDAVVTSDDVTHSKPAPDIFLEAARRLKVAPERCHVFEDGDFGLEAARRAGMSVTDVRLAVRSA